MATNACDRETISAILERLSSYLDKLAAQVFSLEEAVGQVVEVEKKSDSQTIKKLQTLDFLRQSLEDLAMMVLMLASDTGESSIGATDLAKVEKKLKLKITKAILRGETYHIFEDKLEDIGELDLF